LPWHAVIILPELFRDREAIENFSKFLQFFDSITRGGSRRLAHLAGILLEIAVAHGEEFNIKEKFPARGGRRPNPELDSISNGGLHPIEKK
jgi:hypothetical protein